jgi:hypothetical protein
MYNKMSTNGHLAPQATHAQMNKSYYALANGGVLTNTTLTTPTLVAPITLQGTASEGALAVPAKIEVPGTNHGDPDYVGSIALRPGGNVDASGGANGLVIRAAAGTAPATASTIVEVGTDGEGPNKLFIAGPEGVGQVYDGVYNQPVALKNIVLTNVSATNIVDISNNGEIFRCVQDGVAQAAISAIGATIQVPKTGFYTVAIEVKVGNAPVPAPQTVVLPIGVFGGPLPEPGVNNGANLSFAFVGPQPAQTVTPYGLMEVNAIEFSQNDAYTQGTTVVRQYTYMQLLDAEETYRFSMSAGSALWNIGAAGQIKAELIAMC